jgi:D-glycero-D-manno-heptose 1,7-bisphosphate phosphatase
MIDHAGSSFPAPQKKMRPAAFLDRDGVLNVDHGYTYKPEDLELIPTAATAVRLLNEAGYYVIVVSNQSGVARGYFDETAVRQFNEHLKDALLTSGARIDAFYYCPHHPDGEVKALAIRCRCRKPQPGLLEQAARDWPIECARSFLVGDKDIDMAAAQAFNIRGVKFNAKTETLEELVRRELERGTG